MPLWHLARRGAARTVPSARRHAAPRRRVGGEQAALSLEFALAVPVLFVLVLLVFHAVVHARDVLAVQAAAREGVRVAATTPGEAAVVAAVRAALGGREVAVVVEPRQRRPGDQVRVAVTLRSRAGLGDSVVTATAFSRVEPGFGRR